MNALAPYSDEGRGRCAIRPGELPTSFDPRISEWGNLLTEMKESRLAGRQLGELKYLSTQGKEI